LPHQVTAKDGVRMPMIFSPAGTEGMFTAMRALTLDWLTNAERTKAPAPKHEAVMIEPGGARQPIDVGVDSNAQCRASPSAAAEDDDYVKFKSTCPLRWRHDTRRGNVHASPSSRVL
jgi:hypothetical protein